MLEFEVEDSGPGIPAKQDEIFEAFVQVEHHPSGERGTGLGLMISNSLVEMMGGEIRVESEPGQGTLFKVDLPATGRSRDDHTQRPPWQKWLGYRPVSRNGASWWWTITPRTACCWPVC